ncbi:MULTISPECIES: 1-deoxy-D-xylulose-5-phosphate reductoisomerase [unclassified Streptomyces]|uniref:1-deoxy-D-xylulose-5-phosphate reductoisomerase n=1 Tax=unclassified Streptomyces TaxID=2593676 RepID=UPI001371E431|nr:MULTISPECIES: 1-deoxy-D-xylulose-5-phosphate reductoisomerase [unclassified Streptomyces]NEA04556.1 1-deoxy-D-xylulose-5-phosphate reductoisomerase [Streptomyces sp. SID10116]MYY85748.1 1-deoxy-D-xylulose-5-phosphate reductoisomerase [Streptomyces sp. SID335]MYZ12522.1 1-deoxy-D-xylulose-5-phosphate reductoisomerase [Streptomyces sp. SID337]NDZ86667.1 1-deoxy-D-xylulose-5-phosphate reductoisomerase [Streptomyces sp. SID10115]NEB49611.1 1-deoxy-D-xylulose-5-phosphate reductoisomerase [Strept
MSDSPSPLADPHLVFDPLTGDGPRDIVILGSTGSIGTQAIDLVLRNPDRFRVTALSAAGGRVGLLAEQARRLRAGTVAVADEKAVPALREALKGQYAAGERLPEILAGPDAAAELAASACHTVLNGITGSIGLAPTLAALEAGRTLALANKESLIVGGPLVKALAKPGQIIPVDSEHAALFQALAAGTRADVRKLVVTASGGPFRGRTKADLADVTPEDALAHPTWAMGPVITVNSATLVNKGLEVIEAHLLYDIPFDRIEVVVHPQSYVHSMVEFTDGSTLAQATPPDMRGPIAIGLGWPERVPDAAPAFDWTKASSWEFFPLDNDAFPSVGLARRVGELAGTAPAVFNAANEECVDAFLKGALPFNGIMETVTRTVEEHETAVTGGPGTSLTVADVLEAETWARARARELAAKTTAEARA